MPYTFSRYDVEIHWMFILHQLESDHKTGAQASQYVNIGQNCWMLFGSGTYLPLTGASAEI